MRDDTAQYVIEMMIRAIRQRDESRSQEVEVGDDAALAFALYAAMRGDMDATLRQVADVLNPGEYYATEPESDQ